MNKLIGPRIPYIPVTTSDRYGFGHLLAARLGTNPKRMFCLWTHGWYFWKEKLELTDLLGMKLPPRDTILVFGSQEEVDLLKANGYSNAMAGGLPFSYVNHQSIRSNDDVLLAFIQHSAEAEKVSNDCTDYLDYLNSVRKHFESIYVSVYSLDHSESLVKEIRRRSLIPVLGADPTDSRSLIRTRVMLEYCKHVSSNCFGSHIAYALATGCRVSLFSPMFRYRAESYLNTHHGFIKKHAERMEYFYSELFCREKWGFLFDLHPRNGCVRPTLGLDEIGSNLRLNNIKLKAVLGWSFYGQLSGYSRGALRRLRRTVFR